MSDKKANGYPDVPETRVKRLWRESKLPAEGYGFHYDLAKDGSFLRLRYVPEEDPYPVPSATSSNIMDWEPDPFTRALNALVGNSFGGYNESDRFSQDVGGSWYSFLESGWTVLYDARHGCIILLTEDV